MWLVATAGHAEHGKTTLVRRLTGMEPDRPPAGRRTTPAGELGFAWTDLPSGRTVALVDVPGHHDLLPTALTGVAAVSAVLFVVAADGGWMPESAAHLDALHALGIRHGLLVVTRSDLADPRPALRRATAELACTTLAGAPPVVVSGLTGDGLDDLRSAIEGLVERLPKPDPSAPVRLWVDRSVALAGGGAAVHGTLTAGVLRAGEELAVVPSGRRVRVRSLETLGRLSIDVEATARVLVCVDDDSEELVSGDVLVAVGAWRLVSVVDVRLRLRDGPAADLAGDLVLHIGLAAVSAQLRRLGPVSARLTLRSPLPLRIGDAGLLRDPARNAVAAGITVLDILPPALAGPVDPMVRAAELSTMDVRPDGAAELSRRGVVRRADLVAMGCEVPEAMEVGEWLVDPERFDELSRSLVDAVREYAALNPVEPGMSKPTAASLLGLPDWRLVEPLARAGREMGLRLRAGRLVYGQRGPVVPEGAADGLDVLCADLARDPFAAPLGARLAELGLSTKVLGIAVDGGVLLRLADGVYVHPEAVNLARAVLSGLPEPFTVADARTALGTSRRVAVPLLELLDAERVTERLADSRRLLIRKG